MNKAWLLGGLVGTGVVALALWQHGDRLELPQALAALGLGSGKAAKPEVTLEFVAAEVVQPSRMALSRVIEFSGPLVAPDAAVLRSRSAGTLLSLDVAEGSRVRAGQTIGRVDPAEIDSRMAERDAMLQSAHAQLAQAERTHATNQRLADQQFISATALDNSRSALLTAQAQFDAARAALDTLRVARRETVLVAPIAGIVARRYALPGEKLTLEQQVLGIVDLRRLELAGSVGTHEVSLLRPGLPVQVQVEGVETAVTGTLARIAPAAEAGTRSIAVTVALDNPGETLRAGQYALARATLNDEVQRLTLPLSAIGSSGGQEHVWLIADGVLARRAVTTGRRDERSGHVEVLKGLPPQAVVLAARFDGLREGTRAVVVARRSSELASSAASAPALLR